MLPLCLACLLAEFIQSLFPSCTVLLLLLFFVLFFLCVYVSIVIITADRYTNYLNWYIVFFFFFHGIKTNLMVHLREIQQSRFRDKLSVEFCNLKNNAF